MPTWSDKQHRYPRPVTIRFRISEFENEILQEASYLDARAIRKELEKRGLAGSSNDFESPATWAREIIMNVAMEKLRNATPEETAYLQEVREFMKDEKVRLEKLERKKMRQKDKGARVKQ